MTDRRDDTDVNGNPTDLPIIPLPEQVPMDDAAGGPQARDDEDEGDPTEDDLRVQGGE